MPSVGGDRGRVGQQTDSLAARATPPRSASMRSRPTWTGGEAASSPTTSASTGLSRRQGAARARTTASATLERTRRIALFSRRRVHAVGEEDHEQPALGVDPHRGAGEAGVAEGAGGEEAARRGVARRARDRAAGAGLVGRGVPAEGPGRAGNAGPPREALDGLARHDPMVLEDAAVQQHLGEAREVGGGAEEAGVRRDAAQRVGVLVVDLAAQDAARARGRSRWARCAAAARAAAGSIVSFMPRGSKIRSRANASSGSPATRSRISPSRITPEVAVDRLRPRLVGEIHGLDALEVGLLALELLVERRPPVDARRVGEQLGRR